MIWYGERYGETKQAKRGPGYNVPRPRPPPAPSTSPSRVRCGGKKAGGKPAATAAVTANLLFCTINVNDSGEHVINNINSNTTSRGHTVFGFIVGYDYYSLRGSTVNRTYGTHKRLYIYLI